jgi:hypothetical protein
MRDGARWCEMVRDGARRRGLRGWNKLRSGTRSKVGFIVEQVGRVRETFTKTLSMRSVLRNILLILLVYVQGLYTK